jgi:hypothetical protein
MSIASAAGMAERVWHQPFSVRECRALGMSFPHPFIYQCFAAANTIMTSLERCFSPCFVRVVTTTMEHTRVIIASFRHPRETTHQQHDAALIRRPSS